MIARLLGRGATRDLLIALLLVVGVGSVAMALANVSPLLGFGALLDGAFGTRSEIAETLVQATSLLFPALGIAIAFRAGLFNIGAEGQLIVGGFAAGWTGAAVALPAPLAIPLVLASGTLAGAAWGAIPGFLRARFGANEVVATLMLNFIAALLCAYLVGGPLAQAGGGAQETAPLPAAAQLPGIVPDSRLTIAFPLALALAALLRWALQATVFGYELRAAGDAPEAARRAGVDLRRTAIVAMTLAGACAGLGGATVVGGVLHRFNVELSPGYGFIAIAVALVGNLDPLGIVVAAIAFGALQSGGLAMQADAAVPRNVVALVEGLAIVALAGRRIVVRRRTA